MATPFMNLILPTVSLTIGPDWATQLNAALAVVDSHNHTSGNGALVPTAGLNINGDLSFAGFNATQLRTTRYADQGSTLSSAGDTRCLYATGGNLWFNNGAGTPVQITAGGAIAGSPGSISGLVSPASVTYNSGSGTFTFQSAANTAGALDGGPLTIRQMTASAFGITLQSPNALAAAYAITLPGALPAGQRFVTLDSAGVLAAAWNVDGSTIQVGSNLLQVINVTALGANASATIKGNRSAADTGGDVIVDTAVTRTAGDLLSVRNNGAGRFRVTNFGSIALGGTGGVIATSDAANLGLILFGNKNAADAGTDVTLSSLVTRTAGDIFDIQNNGVTLFGVQFNGNVFLQGAAPFIFVATTNAGLTLRGNKSAADAGTDIILNSTVTRTAGNVLDVQNNGSSLLRLDATSPTGAVVLGGTLPRLVAAPTNVGLTYFGRVNAADAGTDHTFNTVNTRTAGALLDVQNNGSSVLYVTPSGPVYLNGGSPQIVAGPTNAGLAFFGRKNAADSGADIVLSGLVTRTTGNLLDVQNNGSSRLQVDFNGNLVFTGATAPILTTTGSNLGLNLRGNKSAADTGTDVIVNSTVTRTAGNLLDVQNNGVSKFTVDFNGKATAQGAVVASNSCKAWAHLTLGAAGAVTVDKGFNIASASYSGANLTINFTTALADSAYAITSGVQFTGNSNFSYVSNGSPPTTTSFVLLFSQANVPTNWASGAVVSVMIFD